MPPKKDKKDKKKKASRKKMRMPMQPPMFATGFNRPIPGGVFAPGGGGGSNIPASFIAAGYASRQPPPATPIQTPDQFNIIQQQREQAILTAEVKEELKKARKERSDKGVPRGPRQPPPETPLGSMTMSEQVQEQTIPMLSSPSVDVPETPESNITRVKNPKVKRLKDVMIQPAMSSFASPAVISSIDFPGGAPINQQGMFMGTPAKLKGSPYDPTSDLDGVPDPISEAAVFLG
jgi:hypothetical protein